MSIPLKEYDTHRVVQKTWAIGQCKSKYHYTPVYNFVKSGPSSKVRHYRTQQLIGNHMYSDVVQGSSEAASSHLLASLGLGSAHCLGLALVSN